MSKFLIVVNANNVRDAQFCIEDDAELDDDEKWKDAYECKLVIGIVDALTKQDAISSQAKTEGVAEDVLDAYELAGDTTKLTVAVKAASKHRRLEKEGRGNFQTYQAWEQSSIELDAALADIGGDLDGKD